MAVNGRGAWTTTGKSNGARTYQFIAGKPQDGANSQFSLDFKAVHSGVEAIQTELRENHAAPTVSDGYFGKLTSNSVKQAQTYRGLTPDGIVGTKTAIVLFRGRMLSAAILAGAPADILYGQTFHESNFDPGARGYFHAPDSGLVQINLESATSVRWDQAFDPAFAFLYSAKRLVLALKKFSGKSAELRIFCGIAAHNSPASAATWYKNETPPNKTIATYVETVLRYSQDL